jgi:flagellar motor switch protein FliM
MPEILSQNQIDELLSEMFAGPIDEEQAVVVETGGKKIKDYDFKSPKKLSKDQIKTLAGVYENFSRHLVSYFAGILRTYCEISVQSIEEQPYFEYNNALPDSILIGVLDAKPIEGPVLVDISNSISFALIERLLGGSGDAAAPEREFTEIEVTLMGRIFRQICSFITEVWFHYLGTEASLRQIETNARLIRSMAMDEVVALVILDVSIKSVRGTISFCIPCINLESILDNLGDSQFTHRRSGDSVQQAETQEAVLSRLKNAPLEVRGVFGRTQLSLGEIINLQVGDVIKLDQNIDGQVQLMIDNKPRFYGFPGLHRNRKTVKISQTV